MRARAAVLLATLGLAAGTAACGADATTSDEEQKVRTTLQQFATAAGKRDYGELCRNILAQSVVDRVRRVNLPCEAALKIALAEVIQPKISVKSVEVEGDTASARVTSSAAGEQDSSDTVQLRKEDGRWKIASLAGA